ncbi:amidohydrolase family protein [Nocardia iowensis]|uniref:Amidohydrolase family protein n=1 Tax=Nocardia iowensis TaxID=204891 RepID=A0ABX8RHS1_NOCIO|nr:amidohydrolase family protein [Nocardia iowensis]QXN89155.1 amidohydrolase family protein [Nocardia iowensis]
MREIDRSEFLAWMAKGAVGAIAGGVLSSLAGRAAGADPGPSAPVTVLAGATVIDGTGAPPMPDTTVVLVGDRIVAVGRFPEIPLPPEVRMLDLAGKFVIPGLWDMHTHIADAERTFLPLHVVHGVTGIREMWGFPHTRDLRRRIDEGQLLGPRMVFAGNIIDGPPGIWPGSEVVATEAEARAAVRRTKESQADFVKVYSLLSRETLTAIADESRKVGLPFAGHVPHRIPVAEAVELGQHTIEHMYGMQLSTSTRTSEFYAEIEANWSDPKVEMARRGSMEREAGETYSPERAAALFDRMIQQGTWQSPTITVEQRYLTGAPTQGPDASEMLRYMPGFIQQFWTARGTGEGQPSDAEIAMAQQNFQARLRLIAAMNAAGVGIVAGTDAGNPFVFPGASLHEELAWLVLAGLSPMQALQAATVNAARCVGLEHVSGTIGVGKYADLVVLDRDPLADIGNTRRIHAVVSRGRYLSDQDRARILREVEVAAAEDDGAVLPSGGMLPHCCSHGR